MKTSPIIIGHRGASALLPENTLASFQTALIEHQAPMIEFDVHLSKDGVPVIIHDATLERTTNGKGFVSHFLLRELKNLDAGFQFDPEKTGKFPFRGKGLTIPTLEEVLTSFPGHELSVEIKERSAAITHAVMALIKKHGSESRCIVGSKYSIISKTMRESYPHVRRFISQNEIVLSYFEFKRGVSKPSKDPRAVASMPLEKCGLLFDHADFIRFLHEKEMMVFYWTINAREQILDLAEKSADGIITDNPKNALAVLKEVQSS
jgi:glycerophosphoryl diester phosphodiesterase